MIDMILTEIPAESASEFHINLNSKKFNLSIFMRTVKFIYEIM